MLTRTLRSIVTDHYLLGPMLIISPKILEEGTLGPANNCQFRMILRIILKKRSLKLQASSSKQRLTMVQGSCRMYLERNNYG